MTLGDQYKIAGPRKELHLRCKWDGKEFIVKKWLLAAGLGLALATSAQAADKIAIVNMGSLFQQVAQKTGVSNTLENEFKGRASELQRMETDLQAKMKKLQSMKAGSDRTKLEKDVMAQRQTLLRKRRLLSRIAHVVPTKNAANWLLVSRLL